MREIAVGLLAAAGITLAVPAHAQGVWFGAGSYAYDYGSYRGSSQAYAPGYGYAPRYNSHAYGPGYYGYHDAYAPRGRADYRAWSRSLNHGQGPGCIQSPASLEYTSCD
jgi:hypothetical protein